MERKISLYLQKWKNDLVRKPLLLYGPRQIGKTFTTLEFGEKEYKNVYFVSGAQGRIIKEHLPKIYIEQPDGTYRLSRHLDRPDHFDPGYRQGFE